MYLQQTTIKAKVWVIVKVIISVLNLIVLVCVMNQSKCHWLLFNALTTSIAWTVHVESKFEQVSNRVTIFLDEFDVKILLS